MLSIEIILFEFKHTKKKTFFPSSKNKMFNYHFVSQSAPVYAHFYVLIKKIKNAMNYTYTKAIVGKKLGRFKFLIQLNSTSTRFVVIVNCLGQNSS